MPTKTLIASARAAHVARRGAEFGVLTGEVRFDMTIAAARARQVSENARASNEAWLKSMSGITFLRGNARLAGPATGVVGRSEMRSEGSACLCKCRRRWATQDE